MTDKELITFARVFLDEAYSRYLTACNLYHSVKLGWHGDALEIARSHKLDQTHPELYAAIQTRASQTSTDR